jgi:hypothetical protein
MYQKEVLSAMTTSIDLKDLRRGEGEWRNMQDVIRNAFLHCFDTQQDQAETILKLNKQIKQLKEEISRRPSFEDIERMIDLRLVSDKKYQSTGGLDNDQCRLSIAKLTKELENKVTLQHFQSTMNRKVDKTDVLIRELTGSATKDTARDVAKLKMDIVDIKSHIEHLTDTIEQDSKFDINRNKLDEEVIVLKSQTENIYRHLNDVYTKDQVKQMNAEKVRMTE